ncbi:f-box domain containing protein [Grosmannia clavigera kw1407]|uniref:F-box domain containing protein n=1 Tax=Grosmannia clavigera (strain kw1407 / UAMH 11150) TaxID=655863 RepID=F0XAT8_GROCL|nr:f-box domain containing protein [Grosmannia clavigera kw1407]EFX05886.1 f-box domain containing protein [Grosmannia clavigera kw1407]
MSLMMGNLADLDDFGRTQHRLCRYQNLTTGTYLSKTQKTDTIATGKPREPLPFHTEAFPPDNQIETTPPSEKMSLLRPPSELQPRGKNDYLSALPVELKMEIMEYLTYEECMALAATSWRMRILEQGTMKTSWRKQQAIRLVSQLRGGDKYYGYQICIDGCGQLLREDCFLTMMAWSEEVATRSTWGADICLKVHDTCVECLQRDGTLDTLFFRQMRKLQTRLWSSSHEGLAAENDKSYEQMYGEIGYLRRRCSCCCRAKVVRPRHWCEVCQTCRACRKNWQLKYGGFCQQCADWRAEALHAYKMTTFPAPTLPLDNEAWYKDIEYHREAKDEQLIAVRELEDIEEEDVSDSA